MPLLTHITRNQCESFQLFKSSISPCDIQGIKGYRIKLLPFLVAGDPPFYVQPQLTTGTKVKMECGHQPVWKLPEQRGLCIHCLLGTLLYHGIQRQWEPPWALGVIRGHLAFPRSQGGHGPGESCRQCEEEAVSTLHEGIPLQVNCRNQCKFWLACSETKCSKNVLNIASIIKGKVIFTVV